MNIKDKNVLQMLNQLIASNRFNKIQILQLVSLASVSKNYDDLQENIKWENIQIKYKTNIKN